MYTRSEATGRHRHESWELRSRQPACTSHERAGVEQHIHLHSGARSPAQAHACLYGGTRAGTLRGHASVYKRAVWARGAPQHFTCASGACARSTVHSLPQSYTPPPFLPHTPRLTLPSPLRACRACRRVSVRARSCALNFWRAPRARRSPSAALSCRSTISISAATRPLAKPSRLGRRYAPLSASPVYPLWSLQGPHPRLVREPPTLIVCF